MRGKSVSFGHIVQMKTDQNESKSANEKKKNVHKLENIGHSTLVYFVRLGPGTSVLTMEVL